MDKYNKGKIYKIYSPSQNIQYIGSTVRDLNDRLKGHEKNYNLYYNQESKYNKYYTSYEVLKCEDYRIILLENYSCNNKIELNKKEGEYIKSNICVNKVIPGRTVKEYYIDNKHKFKEYRKKNILKISEQQKIYRDKNKDKLNKKKRLIKLQCPCGSICRKAEQQRHFRSAKHQNYLKTIKTI